MCLRHCQAVNAGLAGNEQVLGMVLGNGWYNLGATDPFDGGHPISVGQPTLRVRLSLQYVDGTAAEDVVSDASVRPPSRVYFKSTLYRGVFRVRVSPFQGVMTLCHDKAKHVLVF